MGGTRVDDVPGLEAFKDQLGLVADEVEKRLRRRERARPPPRRELGRAQLAQCYEVVIGTVAGRGPRCEALARVVNSPAPFDCVQHCVYKQFVRVPLQVAPDAECNRGRLRWQELSPEWVERGHHDRTSGCLLRKKAYAVMPVGSGWAQPAKPMQLSRWGGKRRVKWAAPAAHWWAAGPASSVRAMTPTAFFHLGICSRHAPPGAPAA